MKIQTPNKITKKTVFVFKAVKTQNSYATNPTLDMGHTQATSFIVAF